MTETESNYTPSRDAGDFPAPEVVQAVEETKKEYKYRIRLHQIAIGILILSGLAVGLAVGLKLTEYNNYRNDVISPITENSNGNITVYYAGSLQDILSRVINPQFTAIYEIDVIGKAAGSNALATLIKNGDPADIFISADQSINVALMKANVVGTTRKATSWYTYWTRTRLGIGYNINSAYSSIFEAIDNGTLPWYNGLDKSIMKIGRTDPNADPKGYRTVILMKLAQTYYNNPNILANVIGTPNNNLQIYAEQTLESLLVDGNIDCGFFYEGEHIWGGTSNLRFISLPVDIDMSDSSYNSQYHKGNYTNTQTHVVYYGSAIVYTLTIPNKAKNINGAIDYIKYLKYLEGTSTLLNEGFFNYPNQSYFGNISAVPYTLLHHSTT